MRCIVPACGNVSTCTSPEIAFFELPTELLCLSSWLRALQLEYLQPEVGSGVCSNHFLQQDLIMHEGQICALRPGAEPLITVKVCRICFATDGNLYAMNSYKSLYQAYETITGLLLEDEEELPQLLCTECARRLLSCSHFRTRSLRAHLLLLDIRKMHDRITLELIQSVNEIQSPLSSNLPYNETQQYDLEIVRCVQKETISNVNEPPRFSKDINNAVIKTEDNGPWVNVDDDDVYEDDFNDHIVHLEDTNINEDSFLDCIKVEDNDIMNKDCFNDDFVCKEESTRLRNINSVNKKSSSDGIKQTKYLYGHGCSSDGRRYIGDVKQKANLRRTGEAVTGAPKDTNETKEAKITHQELEDSDGSDEILNCEICSYQTNRSTQFLNHLKQHANNPEMPYKCYYETKNKESLTEHRSNQMCYSCHLCHRPFRYKGGLKNHINAHHRVPKKQLACNMCDKVLSSVAYLRRHMLHKHLAKKQYACDKCNKMYNKRKSIINHLKSHVSVRPYSCGICKEEFSGNNTLRQHVLFEHF